ncbi:MAG: elongation factor Ts, partial [Clostridiales bacterium]|nr:elongation factor Ts [Clostridiales bacterium]
NCLVDQEFFRDDDLTIAQYIDQSIKAIGANVSVVRFTRFGLGEGIEKKVDDFAEEVRKQAGL